MGTNSSTSKSWPKCPKGTNCEKFRRLKAYGTNKDDLEHCKAQEHPIIPCRWGAQCRAFVRFQQNSWSIADQCHLVCYSHSRANYLGTANLMGCNNIKINNLQDTSHYVVKLSTHGYLPDEKFTPVLRIGMSMEVSM